MFLAAPRIGDVKWIWKSIAINWKFTSIVWLL